MRLPNKKVWLKVIGCLFLCFSELDYEIASSERHPDMVTTALQGLFRQSCYGQCALQAFIVYMLLQHSLAAADTSITTNADIQAFENARWQCYDACCSLLAYEDVNSFQQCLLQCFLLKKRLRYMSVASLLREAQTDSCKDKDLHFQFERQTERMQFFIPQKRRWGNTIAPCISTHCTGLSGPSRVECIVNRCNGNRSRWTETWLEFVEPDSYRVLCAVLNIDLCYWILSLILTKDLRNEDELLMKEYLLSCQLSQC